MTSVLCCIRLLAGRSECSVRDAYFPLVELDFYGGSEDYTLLRSDVAAWLIETRDVVLRYRDVSTLSGCFYFRNRKLIEVVMNACCYDCIELLDPIGCSSEGILYRNSLNHMVITRE